MGSCVSVHKTPDSAISHRWSPVDSNAGKLLISSRVQKLESLNGGDATNAQLTLQPQCPPSRFHDAGSKEEIFFDSLNWLESDCEDDFLSINGDFPPSGGSTPIHPHSSSSRKSLLTKAHVVPEQSPHDKYKILSELFKESSRNYLYLDDEHAALSQENVVPEKAKAAAEGTSSSPLPHIPSNSGGSSERRPPPPSPPPNNNGMLTAYDKSGKPGQCCLPRMISSRSFSERKKKASPARIRSGW